MPLTRRKFVSNSILMSGAALLSSLAPQCLSQAISFDEKDEAMRKKHAKYTLTFSSPYPSADWQASPHMHQELKRNIQEISNGNIFVDILDNGRGGVGPDLVANINYGKKIAALISVSNLTPMAPELDVLNIPFWLKDEQSYLNLVTSKTFNDSIVNKIRNKGKIEILFWYFPGFRTATSTKLSGKTIKVPNDLNDIFFRVPPSETLKQFYDLAGTTTRKISWKRVYKAAQMNAIQAMDPGIVGLYSGPNGLRNHIGVISTIDSVYDGWIAVISKDWIASLDSESRNQLMEASQKTFNEQLIRSMQVKQNCIDGFEKVGVKIYTPTSDEKQQWIDQCGYHRSEWDPHKKRILGDINYFEKLLMASQENHGYTFPT